jgi:hypothetical protein
MTRSIGSIAGGRCENGAKFLVVSTFVHQKRTRPCLQSAFADQDIIAHTGSFGTI